MATSPYLGFFAQQYADYFIPNPHADFVAYPFTIPAVFPGDGEVGAREVSSAGVVIDGGTATTISQQASQGYVAVEDRSTNDVLNGGNNNLTVYLDNNTTFNTDGGSDKIISIGAETVTAGSGATTVQGSAFGTTVSGGSGGVSFFGGSGAVSVVGGSGNNIAFGSQGSAATFLQAGSGNDTLVGGAGGGVSKLVGGNNTYEFASGTGPTTMVAGTGVTVANGQTGSGAELAITSTGYYSLALNNANDTIVGGSGTSVILGGAGQDIYGFLDGHAGGNETIYNLDIATDSLVFGGYTGSPIAAEAVGASGDVLHLTDGTSITLVGVGHTLFT